MRSYLLISDNVDSKTHIAITSSTKHLANSVVADCLELLLIVFCHCKRRELGTGWRRGKKTSGIKVVAIRLLWVGR